VTRGVPNHAFRWLWIQSSSGGSIEIAIMIIVDPDYQPRPATLMPRCGRSPPEIECSPARMLRGRIAR
jgi:hypothetical protein